MNVLMIMTDQQRKDSLGCYGNPKVATPNLDRLSRESVTFERCYVANPICMPARLSLFTGMKASNHGLWTNGVLLDRELDTLASELGKNGYQTASFGKIHFTPYGGDGGNWESQNLWRSMDDSTQWNGPYWGFDHVELTLAHTSMLAHYGRWFKEHGGEPSMLKSPVVETSNSEASPGQKMNMKDPAGEDSWVRHMSVQLHDSTFVAERTVDYLRKRRDKSRPFFAVASFPDPHHPFNPPEEVASLYDYDDVVMPSGGPQDLASRPTHYLQHFHGAWHRKGTVKPKHEGGVGESLTRERIAHTYAMVDLIDRSIGKILDTLAEENLTEDTIIIFTADHGELLGDHGLWLKGPFYYEGLVNVPLMIRIPGTTPFRSRQLISTIDIMPTLCEALGIPIPYYVDGISQLPHVADPTKAVREHCLIEYRNGYEEQDISSKAIITKQFKYVLYQTGQQELTDLVNDPKETTNLIDEEGYREVVATLKDTLLMELIGSESRLLKQIAHA